MSKVMNAYCERHKLNIAEVKFTWDGCTIKPDQRAIDLDPEEDESNQLEAVIKKS